MAANCGTADVQPRRAHERQCRVLSLYLQKINSMVQKLDFTKLKISEANGRELEITELFLKEIIEESKDFLAHHPLDLLTNDFSRDLPRLAKYLNVEFAKSFPGRYIIVPVS